MAMLMPALNPCCKSASYAEKLHVFVSLEEQPSREDIRELQIQVSEKASLSVHGMLCISFSFCFVTAFTALFFLLSLSPLRCFGKTAPSFCQSYCTLSLCWERAFSLAPVPACWTKSSVRLFPLSCIMNTSRPV